METKECHKGQHIWYIPKEGIPEFGIVKSINENMPDHAFIVFNCGGEWEHYSNYTAANTKIADLIPADTFIVKVQLSITTNAETESILIYNEDRDISYQGPVSTDIKEKLNHKLKSFWYAILTDDSKHENGQKIALLNKAPHQNW